MHSVRLFPGTAAFRRTPCHAVLALQGDVLRQREHRFLAGKRKVKACGYRETIRKFCAYVVSSGRATDKVLFFAGIKDSTFGKHYCAVLDKHLNHKSDYF